MFDMVGNIFKNLVKKPSTSGYPFKKREFFNGTRGCVQGIDIDVCIFCGICARKCPSDAIVVDRVSKTWEIDKFKCVVCGMCDEVCPKKCINMGEEYACPALSKGTDRYIQKEKEATGT